MGLLNLHKIINQYFLLTSFLYNYRQTVDSFSLENLIQEGREMLAFKMSSGQNIFILVNLAILIIMNNVKEPKIESSKLRETHLCYKSQI